MSPDELRARLRALPKVDLHRHLEGALRPETLWEFHQAAGQKLHPSLAALRERLVVPPGAAPGFIPFLERFNALRFRYGGRPELARLAREAVADAAADGVVYLELRFSPVFGARRMHETLDPAWNAADPHSEREPRAPPPGEKKQVRRARAPAAPSEWDFGELSRAADVEAAAESTVVAAREEAARRGLAVTFLLCLNRSGGAGLNRPAAELLTRPVGAACAGLDVAGDEAVPVAGVGELVRAWQSAGKKLTVHAGEDPRGDGAARVREAVATWGADRIGHGIRAVEDAGAVAMLVRRGIPLETALTSNVQTRAAASFETHPLARLLRAGVRVTLNSDDPVISGTTLTEEYARAYERAGVSAAELRRIAVHGAEAAFLPPAERAALAQRIAAAWEAWG